MQYCPSPQTYLDLGTGTGKVMQYIKKIVPECECWGIDSNLSMLNKVEDKYQYHLLVANVENLSMMPAEYFDLATARMVFHHTQNIPRAMTEVLRILKTDGLFLVCEGNPPSLRTIDWYTNMFRYKEDRHTLTEVDLINAFVRSDSFADIQTRSVIMRNWKISR
jgi:ubiquinone/menaquinone biosynthesis C-methylase UbiE